MSLAVTGDHEPLLHGDAPHPVDHAPPMAPAIDSIRRRRLSMPLCISHGEGTKQKHITGVQRVVGALEELCRGYPSGNPETDRLTRRKAYSQLAIFMAYQEPDLYADQAGNLKFPLPKEDGTVGYYCLDQTVDFGGGLKAFGFIGRAGDPPLLVFHGTHMKTSDSGIGRTVIADLDPFGVGRTHYALNESAISAWLARATRNGQNKAVVCGHSLGGCFSTYAGVHLHQYVGKVRAFNAPTVNSATYHAWQALEEEERPDMETFHTRGDGLSDYGHGFRVGTHYMLDASQRRYQGSHTAALFVQDDHPTVAEMEITETNREADSWGAKPGRYFRGFLKCFPAVITITAIATKKLFLGCRSWENLGWFNDGLLGGLYGLGKFLLKVIFCIFYVPYVIYQYCTSENSELSEESRGNIRAFFAAALNPNPCMAETAAENIGRLKTAVMKGGEGAEQQFKDGHLSLKEFSVIYLAQALARDHVSPKVRTVPLKVKLMSKATCLSFADPELAAHARDFYTALKGERPKQLLYYLYNEDDYLKDLKRYLLARAPEKTDAIHAGMRESKKHIKAIKEFDIFNRKENWSETSELQHSIRGLSIALAQRCFPPQQGS